MCTYLSGEENIRSLSLICLLLKTMNICFRLFKTVLQTASYDSLMGQKINCILQLVFFFKDRIETIRVYGT